jgi:excisionase family DNA binding protein
MNGTPKTSFSTEIMTMHEVAQFLLCSYGTAFELVRGGELPAFRLGSDWQVWRADVEKWIAKQRPQ